LKERLRRRKSGCSKKGAIIRKKFTTGDSGLGSDIDEVHRSHDKIATGGKIIKVGPKGSLSKTDPRFRRAKMKRGGVARGPRGEGTLSITKRGAIAGKR